MSVTGSLWIGLALVAALLLVLALRAHARRPSNSRNWRDHLARLAHVEVNEHAVSIDPVRDWHFNAHGPIDRSYTAFSAPFSELREVWFVVEPSVESPLAAHTLLMFEFTGDRLICVTIEARLQRGEKWSPFWGLWNRYELFYLWGTARDILPSRAVFLGHRIEIFPTRLTEQQKRGLMINMLKTTAELEFQPRFYNTLFSNCTNELGKRSRLPWNPAFIVTGWAAHFLYRKGIIPGASFKEAEREAQCTERIKALNALPSPEFDAALLAVLRMP